jgi:hypothetical protein
LAGESTNGGKGTLAGALVEGRFAGDDPHEMDS